MGALVAVVDEALAQYCSILLGLLKNVRAQVLGGAETMVDDKTKDLGAVLQLLRLAFQLEKHLKDRGKKLFDAVVGITPKLSAAKGDKKPNLADLTVIR